MMNSPSHPMRLRMILAAALWFVVAPQSSVAAPSCSFTSVSAVNFGIYNVFATVANNSGVGSLTIKCQGGGAATFVVTLGTGQSHNYTSRVMKKGADTLNYNLYTSSARNLIWGDGSGGSSTMTAGRNTTTTLSIFGQIPAGQDAAIGIYSDNITATVNY